ncbi:metallophosphoesterase [Ideonella alba]|uniref:Metallophosphoesterase n=1 Tax=Ideonella alba TaxID=2824118 RepID=A0A941BDH5_9BURK|nr:metallophosphoesterase [Ideonella alba]MBQ0928922.1 metallophosphoesterase [Ideonella alba]
MTNDPIARFDAIHVISDIHMGGKPGFQILKETARLAGFVDRLRTERTGQRLALVLNGDVVDTLAEDIEGYVAINDALPTLQRIVEGPSFGGIWQALAAFVKTEGRHLVVVIGNHDIEVALPPVQRYLLQVLAGDDLAARSRVEFSTTGGGWTCLVGGARVYCTHGNEVDAWNFNRYEDLARAGRRLNAGQRMEPAEWTPNAGTRMVKEVMNSVKKQYPWIDLLKPETQAAVGTLLVMAPEKMNQLGDLLGIVGVKTAGEYQAPRRLSAGDAPAAAPASQTLEQLLGPNLRQAPARDTAQDMLSAAEDQYATAAPTGVPTGQLGTAGLVWDRLTGWIRGIDRPEALRRALLDWLKGDKTFDITDRDTTCTDVLKAVGADVDIIITGHTHLARAIDLGAGRMYFNSGTWIRLMRFTEAMLRSEASFRAVWEVLEKGAMSDLDQASFGAEKLVMDMTTAIEVSVDEDGKQVVGQLVQINGDGRQQGKALKRYTRALA